MGKLYDNYKRQYQEAIAGAKPGDLIVREDVWMFYKWTMDMDIDPWQQPKFYQTLKDALLRDPEFGQVLVSGLEFTLNNVLDKQ